MMCLFNAKKKRKVKPIIFWFGGLFLGQSQPQQGTGGGPACSSTFLYGGIHLQSRDSVTRFYYNVYHLITCVSKPILNSVDKILSFSFQRQEWYTKKLYTVLIWYKKSFDPL